MKLLLTCEHAGNEIPEPYEVYFEGAEEVLRSHRGFDPGAVDLFRELQSMADFSNLQEISRLLVETNRSLGHPQLFSAYTSGLERGSQNDILERYYFSYRNAIESQLAQWLQKGEMVMHISVHSFTPVLDGEVRNADVGLLFDPSRTSEKEFCLAWKKQLRVEDPKLKVRFNYPYLGKADGFTTYLRKKFPQNYSGIELEINQKFVSQNKMERELKETVKRSLSAVLSEK